MCDALYRRPPLSAGTTGLRESSEAMNLDSAINIEDLHRMAKRKLPRIIFDYIEGGVEDERGLARNEAAFHKHRLLPRYLVDVVQTRPVRDRVRPYLFEPVRDFADRRRRPLPSGRRGDAGRSRGGGEYPLHHVGRQQRLDGGSAAGRPEQRLVPTLCGQRRRHHGCTDRAGARRRRGRAGADRRCPGAPEARAQLPQRLFPHPRRRRLGIAEAEAVDPVGGRLPIPPGSSNTCGSAVRRRSGIGRRTPPMARALRTSSLSAAAKPRPRRRPGATSNATGASFRAPSSSRAS